MFFALRIWRHYLYGEKCYFFMDHKSLKYLLVQKNLNSRQHIWVEFLKDYDLATNYHLGKANVMENALSKEPLFSLRAMSACLVLEHDGSILYKLRVKPTFLTKLEICSKVTKVRG